MPDSGSAFQLKPRRGRPGPDPDLLPALARWLRRSREIRGWTQHVLSLAADVPGSSVSLFETGRRKPSEWQWLALVDALAASDSDRTAALLLYFRAD